MCLDPPPLGPGVGFVVMIEPPRSGDGRLCLVVLPCHVVHAGGDFALERVEHQPERADVNLMEKRGEPCLLPLPCGVPYAAQRLGHTLPALRPERALLVRVPLGPRHSLHRLRGQSRASLLRLLVRRSPNDDGTAGSRAGCHRGWPCCADVSGPTGRESPRGGASRGGSGR